MTPWAAHVAPPSTWDCTFLLLQRILKSYSFLQISQNLGREREREFEVKSGIRWLKEMYAIPGIKFPATKPLRLGGAGGSSNGERKIPANLSFMLRSEPFSSKLRFLISPPFLFHFWLPVVWICCNGAVWILRGTWQWAYWLFSPFYFPPFLITVMFSFEVFYFLFF